MFNSAANGMYNNGTDQVKWFAGQEGSIIHITLCTPENEHYFYDHMIHVHEKAFERELVKLCEYYVETVLPKKLPPPLPTDELKDDDKLL